MLVIHALRYIAVVVANSFLLLENGSYVLLEDGSKLILG